MHNFILKVHWNTQKYVEFPAFIMPPTAGGYMHISRSATQVLTPNVGLGLLAIGDYLFVAG